jgi:hypothetical protein
LQSPLVDVADAQVAVHVPSAVPLATSVQVPADPEMLQAWHSGQLVVEQHTPSTQVPTEQFAVEAQAAPNPTLLQSPLMQEYPLAVSHVVLWLAVVHAVAHAPDTHRNPVMHALAGPGVHAVPTPLHSPDSATSLVELAHVVRFGVHAVPL